MKRTQYFLFFSLFFFTFTSTFAQLIVDEQQVKELSEEVNLTTPYHTTLTFFFNLEKNHFQPDLAAKTLDIQGVEGDPEDLAIKLKQVLEGKGVIIRTREIPNDHLS